MGALIWLAIIAIIMIRISKNPANSPRRAARRAAWRPPVPPQDDAPLTPKPVSFSQPAQHSRPSPVNWVLVRKNLDPEEIRDCFDVEALARGVSPEELPQYVRVDRLRQYFSDAQIGTMMDLPYILSRQAGEAPPSSAPHPAPVIRAAQSSATAVEPSRPAGRAQPAVHAEMKQAQPQAAPANPANFTLQGIVFWQVMQPCPGIRYYRRMLG